MPSYSNISGNQFCDLNGRPNAVRAYFYAAGTTTPITVYSDMAETTAHVWPVVASAHGLFPGIFVPFGSYRLKLTLASGEVLFDADNIENDDPAITVPDVTGFVTGDIKPALTYEVQSGWVRLNGRTIGNASSGATERAHADTFDLYVKIWNNVANGQAAVSTGRGASAAADFAANKTLTLPNLQGRALTGVVGMGGTAVTIIDSTIWSNPNVMASTGGADRITLTQGQLPSYNLTGATASDGPTTPTYLGYPATTNIASAGSTNVPDSGSAATTNVGGSLAHTHSITLASGGSGQAHGNMQPSLTVGFYCKL